MNKFTLVLALGTGLTLGWAVPSAQADPIIQTLPTPEMTSAQFNSLFQPIANAPPITSTFQFYGAQVSGVMQSQVFQGTGAAAGLYAYAYQLGVNNVNDANGEPVHVDSASFQFNATPVGTNFLNQSKPAFAYVITDGSVGGLNLPQAAPSGTIQAPTVLSWQPGDKIGVIRAQYVDPDTQAPPLNGGAHSATFVVMSNQPFTQQFVNLGGAEPTVGGLTAVYSATGGSISPVPVPEPATVLAWAGMAAAVVLVRRVRKNRLVA
jgi:hypothetical protein